MTTFRIHFASGEKVDVTAETADAARKLPAVKAAGTITKIKVLKGA